MISARSLRLLLNGSKWCLLLVLFPLFTFSCELLKPARSTNTDSNNGEELGDIHGKRIFDPETGTYITIEETVTETMDTIIWKDVPPGSDPPITSETVAVVQQGNTSKVIGTGQFGSQLLSSYNIAVMLPFLTDRFSETAPELQNNSLWAVNFYGGMKLALEDLGQEGANFNVSVIDTKANEASVQSLLRSPEVGNSHLIIGPYRRDNVRLVADYARDNNKTLVSPQSAAAGLSTKNSNYVQVSPTLKTHCEAITRHALKDYRPDQIVLVARDNPSEITRFQFFRDELHRQYGTRDTSGFKEFVIFR